MTLPTPGGPQHRARAIVAAIRRDRLAAPPGVPDARTCRSSNCASGSPRTSSLRCSRWLEPGGVLSGMDAVLFVRTSPANLEQIRQAVAMLDRQPRQLLVSVGQGTVVNERDVAVRGTATVGDDHVQVGVNRPPGDRHERDRAGATGPAKHGPAQRQQRHDARGCRDVHRRRPVRAAHHDPGEPRLGGAHRRPDHRVSHREHGLLRDRRASAATW